MQLALIQQPNVSLKNSTKSSQQNSRDKMSAYHKLRSLYQLLVHILLAKSLQLLGLPQNPRDKKMYSAWEFF